jgi:hypothetical protein
MNRYTKIQIGIVIITLVILSGGSYWIFRLLQGDEKYEKAQPDDLRFTVKPVKRTFSNQTDQIIFDLTMENIEDNGIEISSSWYDYNHLSYTIRPRSDHTTVECVGYGYRDYRNFNILLKPGHLSNIEFNIMNGWYYYRWDNESYWWDDDNLYIWNRTGVFQIDFYSQILENEPYDYRYYPNCWVTCNCTFTVI